MEDYADVVVAAEGEVPAHEEHTGDSVAPEAQEEAQPSAPEAAADGEVEATSEAESRGAEAPDNAVVDTADAENSPGGEETVEEDSKQEQQQQQEKAEQKEDSNEQKMKEEKEEEKEEEKGGEKEEEKEEEEKATNEQEGVNEEQEEKTVEAMSEEVEDRKEDVKEEKAVDKTEQEEDGADSLADELAAQCETIGEEEEGDDLSSSAEKQETPEEGSSAVIAPAQDEPSLADVAAAESEDDGDIAAVEQKEDRDDLTPPNPHEEEVQEDDWTKPQVMKLFADLKTALEREQFANQIRVARNLAQASKLEAVKTEFIRNMALVVKLMEIGSIDVQQSAVEILNNIGTKDAAKEAFRKEGGFPVIVSLLDAVFEVRTLALNAIGYLITKNAENAQALLDAEGVQPIAELLGNDNSRIKFFAAACCWVLAAYQKKYQNVLLEAGAVPKLLKLVNSDHEDIAWQATGAIRNLVLKNRAVHKAMLEAKCLKVFLKAIGPEGRVSERVFSLLLQALVILTATPFVKDAATGSGLMKALLSHFETADDEKLMRVLSVLTHLCSKHKDNQIEFKDIHGLEALVSVLEKDNEKVRSAATSCIWAATINNALCVDYLYNSGVLESLQQRLFLEKETVLVGIVAALGNMANTSTEYQDLLRERNIIPVLLDFLRCKTPALLETTAGAVMAAMRGNEANVKHTLEWDGPLLLARLIFSQNLGVQQNVTGALRALFAVAPAKTLKAVKEVEGLKNLLLMLKETQVPQLQINAATCLLAMFELDPKSRLEACDKHAELGIRACLGSAVTKLRCVTSDVIAILAPVEEEFRAKLGEQDVVKLLIDVISDEKCTGVLLEKSIRALWGVCLNHPGHQQIVRVTNCLDRLADMLIDEETTMLTNAVVLKALASVCSKNGPNQEAIRLKPGAVERIIELLTVGLEVEAIGENVALLIWCLCVGNSRMQNLFREKGGIVPLVELLSSKEGTETLYINATGAVSSLCAGNKLNRAALSEAGVATVLQALQTHPNIHVTGQADSILAEL